MRSRAFVILFALILSLTLNPLRFTTAEPSVRASVVRTSDDIPTPASVLGFTPGDDRKLASWNQVVDYLRKLDNASNRLNFETLGTTTMGNPFVMATISSPENLAHLDEYKRVQQVLADPRKLGPPAERNRKAAELIARGKTVVLITCGIHSTEVGSYLSSMLIAYRLASSNDPEVNNILAHTIILLVPSLNPDGVDIVKNWYDKTLGTPYEGTEPPELYHKYTGHDNNRDWYAFTQVETQIAVDKIHNVWHPQIVHDIHQQGEYGARLFLPPYMSPVEPNVPGQIVREYTELGNWTASELRAKGFKGITTNSTYDAWSPSRAYSHYHGGVRILSETASARIASPVSIKFTDLRQQEGYDPQKQSTRFGPLWRGGEWRLRDITNYMTTAAFVLLQHAATNHQEWLRSFYRLSSDAVSPRKRGELFAFLIPASGRLASVLTRAGVEVQPTTKSISTRFGYRQQAAVVRMDQPYAGFAKAILQPERYPDLRDAAGHPIEPYDVTAHTLSLLMGEEAMPIYHKFNYQVEDAQPNVPIDSSRDLGVGIYRSNVPTVDEGWTRWVLDSKQFKYTSVGDKNIRAGGLRSTFKSIVIPDQAPTAIMNGNASGRMPVDYTGGLGAEGVRALREFVEQGGTLICFNRASDFAIEQFKLPLQDIVARLPRADFYVPGSILRIEVDNNQPIARGLNKESIAWVEDSPVFEIANSASEKERERIQVIARYDIKKDPLLSGWLLGADRIKGKAALVEVSLGKGQIVLFGFRPQYRGQSFATYPLFFNALN